MCNIQYVDATWIIIMTSVFCFVFCYIFISFFPNPNFFSIILQAFPD